MNSFSRGNGTKAIGLALMWLSGLSASLPVARADDSNRGKTKPIAAGPDLANPYSRDQNHLWNRLHRTFFVRQDRHGVEHVHRIDPLLFGSAGPATFLLTGEPHRQAVAILDEFLAARTPPMPEGAWQRVLLQRDLWAAFDYVAWYPDDWVHQTADEPQARALRQRLARAIARLAVDEADIRNLPDNYTQAAKAGEFAPAYDPNRPEAPFLPPDLFDPAGPWVRTHSDSSVPVAAEHFASAGGRAAHVVLLRLPGGRQETLRYLDELPKGTAGELPVGTMVALVRRALTIDRGHKIRVTPLTENVQIRVYREIEPRPPVPELLPATPVLPPQVACEFLLHRPALFAGESGLRAVAPDDPFESFERIHSDPFTGNHDRSAPGRQLVSCGHCHSDAGIASVTSLQRALKLARHVNFRTYDWDVELSYSVKAKAKQYDWGLLQGLLEQGD